MPADHRKGDGSKPSEFQKFEIQSEMLHFEREARSGISLPCVDRCSRLTVPLREIWRFERVLERWL